MNATANNIKKLTISLNTPIERETNNRLDTKIQLRYLALERIL